MSITPYTRVPNVILEAMQSMPEIEAKLTAVLVRETYGRQSDDTRLTWDMMQEMTGLSRASVGKAMDMVELRGFFFRGRKSTWTATLPNSTMSANSSRGELNGDSNSSRGELDNGQNSSRGELNGDSNSSRGELDESSRGEPSPIREKKDPNGSKKKKTTPTPPPDPALAEMVNALVDATGMSAHLNWGKLSDLARELLGSGYTAGQVAQVYAPGGWWDACDWRGQKGQRPGVTAVRETIRLGAAWNGQLPARASPGNGANVQQPTRAEAAALEYAAMRESFFRQE